MVLRTSLSLLTLCGPGLLLSAQTQPSADPAPAPLQAALPSALLQPSLDVLHTALAGLRPDRWKASSTIREEAQNNIGSIQRDVQSTLPPLLAAADAAPASAAKVVPAFRNVDALYDVLLRVDAVARLTAPSDQASALDQALSNLEDSRRTLGEQLQRNADAQEKQVVHLQAALKAVPPAAPPPPVVAPVKCPTTPVRRRRPTTAKKPTTSTKPQTSSTTSH